MVLTASAGHRVAARVVIRDGIAWLIPASLPPDDAARQVYVLWQITGARTPLAVGSFDIRRGHGTPQRVGALAVPYRRTRAFAVSLERGRAIPRRPRGRWRSARRRAELIPPPLNHAAPCGEHSQTNFRSGSGTPMRNTLLIRGGVGLAALSLAAAACGSSGTSGSGAASTPKSSPSPSMHSMSPAASGMTNTAAAQLYAGLDQLLREHVDLTANVVQVAVTKGATSGAAKQALAALDQNTQGLGKAIGSVYGAAAQAQFLKLWRAHIGYFVNYTLGVAAHNPAKISTASKDLAGYTAQFSKFVASATKLPAAAVAADLKGHVSTLETAINAIVARSPQAGKKIEMAAMHMDGTAQVLAKGIVASKGISGSVTGAGASLRAALTGLLIQHVAATAFVVQTAVAGGGNMSAPEVKGAVSALADNTSQLGAAIGSTYGSAAQQEFLKLWNAHIGYFVNYTLGKATHDTARAATAKKDLAGYITKFSQFIAGATKLPVSAVAADLQGHVATLETTINSIVAGSPKASMDLLMAENHMAGTGAVLAQGIAASMPAKFAS